MMLMNRSKALFEAEKATIYDISDGVVELVFHAEDGTIDAETAQWAANTLVAAESDIRGVLITAEGEDFCSGIDTTKIRECAKANQEQELKEAAEGFQSLTNLVKHFSKPVVVVAGGKTLDFGAELVICAKNVVATDDMVMGFQTRKNGLPPMGGGLTELALKIYEIGEKVPGYDCVPFLKRLFIPLYLNMASKNLEDAQKKGLLNGDVLVVSRENAKEQAKRWVLYLSERVESKPGEEPRAVTVSGVTGSSALDVLLMNAEAGQFITSDDRKIALLMAKVLCGGGVPRRTVITEERFLELEKSTFVEACLSIEDEVAA